MVSTILLMAVVLAVATRASDAMRLRQEEVILKKLPLAEAHEYYEVLRRRARRVRVMRAVTLAALLLAMLAGRRRLLPPPKPPASDSASESVRRPPTSTDAAKALAQAELARQAARGSIDPTRLELRSVTGDDKHPWIFEYTPISTAPGDGAARTTDRVRIYIDRTGAAELHRLP
jgi:hypothetical protein